MKKISVLLLCYALLFAPFASTAAINSEGHDNISSFFLSVGTNMSAKRPMTFTDIIHLSDTATPESLGNDILQFKAGSHIMGFARHKVYLVNKAGFLSIEFMGTKGVKPKVAAGKAQGNRQGFEQLGKVDYPNLWKGITLSYEGIKDGIAESIYRIEPGSDVEEIKLKYNAETVLQKDGSLKIKVPTDRGWMIESRPVAWQEIGSRRVPVKVAFKIEDRHLGFRVADYDRNRDLIIDPTYQWHTFYGSAHGDDEFSMTVDNSGNVYVAGSSSAPWTGPGGRKPLNVFVRTVSNVEVDFNIFVLKLNSNGEYQWHTFYSYFYDWSGARGSSIAVDRGGNVYVAGAGTAILNIPGRPAPINSNGSRFLLKLNTDGAYQWHTFYGTSGSCGSSIAVDGSSNLYLVGSSNAAWSGPEGQRPLNAYSGGGGHNIYIMKLNSDGAYQWHTFHGPTAAANERADEVYKSVGLGIATDDNANVFVTGTTTSTWKGPGGQDSINACNADHSIFVLKLNTEGAYQWHSFYGVHSYAKSIAVDGSGNVCVTGNSQNTWNGFRDRRPLNAYNGKSYFNDRVAANIFILKLNNDGTYQWHTFYGSSQGDNSGKGITVDGRGNVYVQGNSATWDSPRVAPPLNGNSGMFVLKLNSCGAYQWYTFYGSQNDEPDNAIAVDGSGGVYTTGNASSPWNAPDATMPLKRDGDMFVLKLLEPSGSICAIPSLEFIPAPNRADMVHDSKRNMLYITSHDQVLRYDMNSSSFLSPWLLGGYLGGIDISPDAKALAVADFSTARGQVWVDLVNIEDGFNQKLLMDAGWTEGGTIDVAFGGDGKIYSTSNTQGTGFQPFRQIDPQNGTVANLLDVVDWTFLSRSANGNVIGLFEGNSGLGSFDVTNSELKHGDDGFAGYNRQFAVNRDGSQFAVETNYGAYVYDKALNRIRTLCGDPLAYPKGIAYDPLTNDIYVALANIPIVRAYDSTTFETLADYDFGQSLADMDDTCVHCLGHTGRLKTSVDGRILFALVKDGIEYLYTHPRTLTVAKSSALSGTGKVTSTPAGIYCGSRCAATTGSFNSDATVTLTAVADDNSTFGGWSGPECEGGDTCTVTMDADILVTAAFSSQPMYAYKISPTYQVINPSGRNLAVKITCSGENNCPAPTIGAHDEWISQAGAITWKDNKGIMKVAIQKNISSRSRKGVIWIGGTALKITQVGVRCQLNPLQPSSEKFTNEGGSGSFHVMVSPQDCGWSVNTAADWIHLNTSAGSGNGDIDFHVDSNVSGRKRTEKINVLLSSDAKKRRTFSLRQDK